MQFRLLMIGVAMLLAAIMAFGFYKAFLEPPPFCPQGNPHCGNLPPGDPTYRP